MMLEAVTTTVADADREEDSQNVEKRIRSMLDSLTKSNETTPDKLAAYHKRLETFRPLTFFAKPPSLSPIVCARFGWTNVGEDLVVCSDCKAAVVVQIHPNLSTSAALEVCRSIEVELAKAHSLDCPFRSDAEQHLLSPKQDATQSPQQQQQLPAYMASILSPSSLELMEHPCPQEQLRHRTWELVKHLGLRQSNSTSSDDQAKTQPIMEVPRDLVEFTVGQDRRQDEEGSTLISRLRRILELPSVDEPAIMLALLGWEPSSTVTIADEGETAVVDVICHVCLADAQISLTDANGTTEQDQQETDEGGDKTDDNVDDATPEHDNKRPRTSTTSLMNPILSHRHYCPFVCGFPPSGTWSGTPLWKKIASRILQSDQSTDLNDSRVEDSVKRIHTMLRAGIASSSSLTNNQSGVGKQKHS